MRLTLLIMALAAFAFGGGFAVGQSALVLLGTGTWHFTQNGISNDGYADYRLRLYNTGGLGAYLHVTGNGTTGLLASRLTNDKQGPVVRFHKGRGDPDNMAVVRSDDLLGAVNFSGSTNSQDIAMGATITARVIAANPSETDMETEICINAVGPGSVVLTEVVCFSVADGMSFNGRRMINRDGSVVR